MNAEFEHCVPRQIFASCIFIISLVIGALAYAPGLGGSVHFDDFHNLDGLIRLHETSAMTFIMDGAAGLFGRPIAYASFVPQAYAWPDAPEVLLHTNVCLHLLNGALVVWLLYLLSVARKSTSNEAAWVAVLGGAIWMLLPILASSSLLIVQRMTVLSATFVLLGFVAYLYCRALLHTHPRRAILGMSASIAVGTGLAVLTKENGALLPIFVLVAETTILPRPAGHFARSWHGWWRLIFLVLPAVGILGYVALRFQYTEATLLKRDFAAPDRLLTQAHILWEYLFHAFLPATSNLGPFHDSYPVYRDWSSPSAAVAVTAWLGLGAIAIGLRQRFPLFTFAVFWYLGGHALESTTIPLELYFEHRNYVPLIGPVFALVAALSAAPIGKRISQSALIAYATSLAIVLLHMTSLWGQPALAAEMWAIHNPDSMRATQYLAQQYEHSGDYATARRVLRSYLERNPADTAMELQVLSLSCVLEPNVPHDESLARIERGLEYAAFHHGVYEVLKTLYRSAEQGRCDTVDRDSVYRLTAVTASNPAYQADATAHHNLHILMAEDAFARRDLGLTMRHIESALDAAYEITTLSLAVKMLNSAGLYNESQRFVREARAHEPSHPLRAAAWREQLARLEEVILAQRSKSG